MMNETMQNLPPMPGNMEGGQLPPMPGSMMGADASAPMSQEEMRANLQAGYDKVKNKEREVNSVKLMSQNELSDLRKNIVTQFFKAMKRAGVDPNNLESIRSFIEKLEKSNPDIAEMFTVAFDGLVGEDESEGLPPEGLIGKFGNLSQSMMGDGQTPPMAGQEMPPMPEQEMMQQ